VIQRKELERIKNEEVIVILGWSSSRLENKTLGGYGSKIERTFCFCKPGGEKILDLPNYPVFLLVR
jgi:hypothetical protein